MSMTAREVWVTGSEALMSLPKDDLILARALRHRDYKLLYAAAFVASSQIDGNLALTDSLRYKALMEGITRYHLKGYGILNLPLLEQLAEGSETGTSQEPADAPQAPA